MNEMEGEETVEQMLDNYHTAASKADSEQYFGFFTADAYFIGTDALERWTIEEFRKFAMPFMEKGQGWTYRPQKRHVNYSKDMQVAWFDEILENDRFGVTRSSGVAVREGKRWKVAQYHLCVPIPNDLMDSVVKLIRDHEISPNSV